MEFRRLGRSGLKVSEISYGNWLTHGSQVEAEQAHACVREALDVGIVVEDMDAAVAFFVELGMELEGRAVVEGLVADQCTGLDGVTGGPSPARARTDSSPAAASP